MLTDFRAAKMSCLLADGLSKTKVARRLKMSAHTIDKYRSLGQLPSQVPRPPRNYRTRNDPLAPYWTLIEERLARGRQEFETVRDTRLADSKKLRSRQRAVADFVGHATDARTSHSGVED